MFTPIQNVAEKPRRILINKLQQPPTIMERSESDLGLYNMMSIVNEVDVKILTGEIFKLRKCMIEKYIFPFRPSMIRSPTSGMRTFYYLNKR